VSNPAPPALGLAVLRGFPFSFVFHPRLEAVLGYRFSSLPTRGTLPPYGHLPMTTMDPGPQVAPAGGRRWVFLAWSIGAVVGTLSIFNLTLSGGPAGTVLDRDHRISLRPGLDPEEKLTASIDPNDLTKAVRMYVELTGRDLLPLRASWSERLDRAVGGRLSRWRILRPRPRTDSGISYHRDGRLSAGELKEELEAVFRSAGLSPVAVGAGGFKLVWVGPGLRAGPGPRQ
jgi:hypothetical protein